MWSLRAMLSTEYIKNWTGHSMHSMTDNNVLFVNAVDTAPLNANDRGRQVRYDIEGLRAIAVLSVLIDHAFPKALTGGFAGVDIFFVISGYLIGRHLLEDIQAGHFSILGF